MAKIRELALKDIPKLKKLISFMDVPVKPPIDGLVLPYPLKMILRLLPMRWKFLPESYVLIENKEIQAYITVKKARGNHRKWRISKLFLANNANEAGLLLIQYIIAKFGAKGAHTFMAMVEDSQNELIQLFVEGAGFRHCSRQQIWKSTTLHNENTDFGGLIVRPFKNSDAQNIAVLYNEAIQTHFRPSLMRSKKEFHDNFFSGLTSVSEFKYVIENREKKQILAYFTVKTPDNKNYLLDLTVPKGFEYLYPQIISYALRQAKRRTKDLNFYIVNRYYMQTAADLENLLNENAYQPSNNSIVLIKDLFKTVKDHNFAKQALFYTEIGSNPAFKSQLL